MVLECKSPGERKIACDIRQKTLVLAVLVLTLVSGCQTGAEKEKELKEQPEFTEREYTPYEPEAYTTEGAVVHPYAAGTDQYGILHVGNYEQKGQIAAIMDTVSHEVKAKLAKEQLIHALIFSPENEMIAATDYTLHHFNQRIAGSPRTYTMLPEKTLIKDLTFSSTGKLYVLVKNEDEKSQIYHITQDGTADKWTTLSGDYDIIKWSDMHKGLFFAGASHQKITLMKAENEQPSEEKSWVTLPSGSSGGLALDSLGGVLVSVRGAGQVIRYDERGDKDRVVDIEDENPGTLVMGGENGRHCFVLTEGSEQVFMFAVPAPGQGWVRANY